MGERTITGKLDESRNMKKEEENGNVIQRNVTYPNQTNLKLLTSTPDLSKII